MRGVCIRNWLLAKDSDVREELQEGGHTGRRKLQGRQRETTLANT